jgi:hypothetical protein
LYPGYIVSGDQPDDPVVGALVLVGQLIAEVDDATSIDDTGEHLRLEAGRRSLNLRPKGGRGPTEVEDGQGGLQLVHVRSLPVSARPTYS